MNPKKRTREELEHYLEWRMYEKQYLTICLLCLLASHGYLAMHIAGAGTILCTTVGFLAGFIYAIHREIYLDQVKDIHKKYLEEKFPVLGQKGEG